MQKQIKAVELFHKTFGHSISEKPIANIPQDRKILRYNLMLEENKEYLDATENNNIIEVADALGDMLYILCGTIIEHGLQHKIEEVFEEIQRSNMSKLGEDGKPIYRGDGKIMKGQNYSKPDIAKILEPVKKRFISIAALSGNEVIAKDGKIPWHLPNDFKRFKEVTFGSHIIMGRKTFESLPGLLKGRTHVVITRNKDFHKLSEEGIVIVNSLQEAMDVCPAGNNYIIGGGEIYQQAMSFVDELDLTIVDTTVIGENLTMFPSAMQAMGDFVLVDRINNFKDEKHEFNYSFMRLVRKSTLKK
jgi:dihydrofolate reductase/predicted HAD superfamily Cof-like phosphohydrolase